MTDIVENSLVYKLSVAHKRIAEMEASLKDITDSNARFKTANETISKECVRLVEENVRARAALRGFMDRQPVLDVLADGGDFPDTYVISVGCTLGDYRRARKELLGAPL